MKFIVVSGGVVSGLGKGTISASLALLLKSQGYRVSPVKIDMYLNVDAGTIRPQEHGEVFVTHDGIETDEDIGHYERFLHENLDKQNYITTGQIYQEVIRRERAFEYEGEDVEAIPHVTDEIVRRIRLAGETHKAEIVIVELGGTVGEYQNNIFFEATRIMKLKNPKDVIQLHVTYLPYLANIGELKSKPAQTSVHILNGMGIHPDVIVARAEKPIDKRRLERLALFCNIKGDYIFSCSDMPSVYEVPLLLANSGKGLDDVCLRLLGLAVKKHTLLDNWQELTKKIHRPKGKALKIAMVGKYFVTGDYQLSDSYVSVIEALKHASWKMGCNISLSWIDSEDLEEKRASLGGFDGIIVPQGWGARGTEGKVMAAKYAREKGIPYLGLCFGMQMATIEFARNVLGLIKANTTEADAQTPYPVIHIMPNQAEYLSKRQYGGTIRLGAWPCVVKKGTKLGEAYLKYAKVKNAGRLLIYERHRHRYEFNNRYREKFEKNGFVISGTSPDGKLVEAIEIKSHPFFVGTQFHPEYISRPLTPHPIFVSFIEAILKIKSGQQP
ncbi:MAG: CTP synthase [Patescibacteria group bacterium]